MNLDKPSAKIVLLGLIVLVLILFSYTLPAPRSPLQQSFDEWLKQEETLLNDMASHPEAQNAANFESAGQKLTVSLQVAPQPPDLVKNIELTLSAEPRQAANILRLLELMREADIFSIGERAGVKATDRPRVSLNVSHASGTFTAHFEEADIRENVPAQLLLKLFNEYSQQPRERKKDT